MNDRDHPFAFAKPSTDIGYGVIHPPVRIKLVTEQRWTPILVTLETGRLSPVIDHVLYHRFEIEASPTPTIDLIDDEAQCPSLKHRFGIKLKANADFHFASPPLYRSTGNPLPVQSRQPPSMLMTFV